ncbi:SHC-transforming protein 4-like [Genypterus blacodes]|uniref:SHC-transforming protein 4-like n=1 Tax=Genypterus blacodes TaxID=154954 RepID=UPI003F775C39
MRAQTSPRLRTHTAHIPASMLQRTKYSRLRNDSLSPLEDRPQRALPLKSDLCFESDFTQLEPPTPADHGPSTLRGFIPRIRLHSPISLLRGQTSRPRDGATDRPLPRTDWDLGPNRRLCPTQSQTQALSALQCMKRPISLHQMASLPWTPGCPPHCLKTSSAGDGCRLSRVVHYHIKYMGSVEVTQSMRTLDFDMRMQVTR